MMGLWIATGDGKHECWHGSFGRFHAWLYKIAEATGLDLDKMEGFANDGETTIEWSSLSPDPLYILLNYSDDGAIDATDCVKILRRLEEIYPLLPGEVVVPIKALSRRALDVNVQEATQRFINGLQGAVSEGKGVLLR